MDLGIQDTIFLITGGTSGLGLATAGCLIGEGARVVVSSPHAQSVERAIAKLGGNEHTLGVVADNADPASADRLVSAALRGAAASPARHPWPGQRIGTGACVAAI